MAEESKRQGAISTVPGLRSPFQRQASPLQNGPHIVHAFHVLLALMVVASEYG